GPAPSPHRRSRGSLNTRWKARRRADRDHRPMNVPTDLLSSLGICVGLLARIASVTWRFRQPLIIAYLATGVIIGPIGLGFIKNQGSISTVAEIGLILLLF